MKNVAVLRADTYVTRGAPSTGALAPTGRGLEFAPETNPDAVFLDQPFAFRLLVDGRPAAGVTVLARRGDEAYAEHKTQVAVTTGAGGRALLKAPLAGVYVLAAKYPTTPAPGGRPPGRTYVSTVTVEVTP